MFDLELDKFGVDSQELKDAVVLIEFVEWSEEYEKEIKKKNCPVVKACFLTKYKNLSLLFKYNCEVHTVDKGNIEFWHRKTGGWILIRKGTDEHVEDECFCPCLFVTQIWNYPQAEGMKVNKPCVGSLEENQYEPPNYDTSINNYFKSSLWHSTFVASFFSYVTVLSCMQF